MREHSYAMDIYVWFRWRDPSINPSDTVEIVNPSELWGHVRNLQYEQPLLLPSGELYQVLRMQGRFSRKFFFNSFPYDRQKLVVEFEDSVNELNRLVYVADEKPISINPRLVLDFQSDLRRCHQRIAGIRRRAGVTHGYLVPCLTRK